MAVVILAIAAAGLLLPFTSGARVLAEGIRRTLAAELASNLMERIIRTPFDQVVADFDGYVEPQGQVKDVNGNVLSDPAYSNFSREAHCQYVYVPQEGGITSPIFIRATVEVYYRGSKIAAVNRLITR